MFDASLVLVLRRHLVRPQSPPPLVGTQRLLRQFLQYNLRPGGQLLYSLRMFDGQEMWPKIRLTRNPPRPTLPLAFSLDPSLTSHAAVTCAPFNPKWPLEILNTLTLSEHFNQTRLVLMGEPLNPIAEELELFESMLDSLHDGFSGTS